MDETLVQTIVVELSARTRKLRYDVKAGSHLVLICMYFGSSDLNVSVSVHLKGYGSRATIVGCIGCAGDARVDMTTHQVHEKPGTTSDLLVKTVLKDRSFFSYQGDIVVEKDAQKTDAYQRNENILLGRGSVAKSSPVLEILANDVRCTHGSTTGPIDDEQLWYLHSRGISDTLARKLCIEGFFASAFERIPESRQKSEAWKKIQSQV